MLRFIQGLIVMLAVIVTAGSVPALAQSCWIAPGSYVDTDPGEGVSPGLVMTVAGMPCWADVRLLALPDQPFDPYTRSFYEYDLAPLDGPPPYDKPNGCPYAAGEPVDMKDQYDTWYPGVIASASRDCGYQVDYWMGAQQKSFGASHADLRPASLVPPVIDPKLLPGPDGVPPVVVEACTNGPKLADLGGDDADSRFRFAVVEAINSNQTGADFSVGFESLVEGESVVATPGSDAARRYQDAASGAAIHRYRMVLSICEEDRDYGGAPYVVRYRYDQSCYNDMFGGFVCSIDSAKKLQ